MVDWGLDRVHASGCRGCDPLTEWTGQCHGCGHGRDDVWDYDIGYYCTDCVIAIERWRRARAEGWPSLGVDERVNGWDP
jgi:hypothetical protein